MTPIKVLGVSVTAVLPELVLGVGGLVVLMFGAALRKRAAGVLAALSLLVLLGAAVSTIPLIGESRYAFDDTVALDGFAIFFKIVLIAAAMVTVLASHRFLDAEDAPATEFYGLVILATAGMSLMAAATDLIVVFLALETFSLALYVMAAFRRARLDSQEAALKYFLTGSFSSAFFLFGIALMYGATRSTRFPAIAKALADGTAEPTLALVGAGLLLVGLAFKVAAVPFHMWTPDAYQGAPAPVAGFMAGCSKAAGFAVLLRLFAGVMGTHIDYKPVMAAIAVASMLIGSFVAIAQANVKRMLAYSAIAHTGFLLLGVIAQSSQGRTGSLFYLAVYGFTIIGAFAIVYALARPGEGRVNLEDYRGLWSRQPFLAVCFAILLVSLAGIPPTGGFWAKFQVFTAAVGAGQVSLAVIGVLTSAVAAFFYLRLIVLMFLEEKEDWDGQLEPSTAPGLGMAILVAAALVLLLGVLPDPLLDFAQRATLVR